MTNPLDSTSILPNHTPSATPIQVPVGAIVAMAKQPMIILARGIISILAHLNYEQVVVCFAEACGELLAEVTWSSDLLITIKLRKRIADGFERGMKRIPTMQPAMNANSADQMPQHPHNNGNGATKQ